MARANQRIEIQIAAEDDASRIIDKVAAEVRNLDDADVEVGAEPGGFAAISDELDGITAQLDGLPGAAGQFAGALRGLAGPAGLISGVVGGLAAAAARTVEIADEVSQIATALDLTVEEASRLRAVFGDSGIEANDLVDIALQVTGAVSDSADAAARIGLTIDDAQDPATALKAAIDDWDFLSATERAELFGEEGVRQIAALIARGEDLEDLLAGVEPGRIYSAQDIADAREMSELVGELKARFESVTAEIGQGVLPGLVAILDGLLAIEEKTAAGSGLFDFLVPFADIGGEWEEAGVEAAESFTDGFGETTRQEYEATGVALVEAMGDAADEVRIRYGRLRYAVGTELADAARRGVDAGKRIAEVGDEASDVADDVGLIVDALDELDREAARLRLQEKLADAGEQADLTRLDIVELTQDVADYGIEVLGIPRERVTKMVARADPQSVADVRELYDELEETRTTDFIVRVREETIGPRPPTGGYSPGGLFPDIGRTTNNYYLTNPDARRLANDLARQDRINGLQ